jgi:hypothetical protein
MKVAVFWNAVPCSLVEIDLHFRDVLLTSLLMEAVSISETSVIFCQTGATSQKTAMFNNWFPSGTDMTDEKDT